MIACVPVTYRAQFPYASQALATVAVVEKLKKPRARPGFAAIADSATASTTKLSEEARPATVQFTKPEPDGLPIRAVTGLLGE